MTGIYHLQRKELADWDEMCGIIVWAETSAQARALAASCAGDEGPSTWHDVERTSCRKIGFSERVRPADVILTDFKHG